ncbi:DM13 domain-containing protein [Amaricoccus macauensis]|uniref:DM13 domain-containing protein n=1 Tax=Amaricoccus macauensis TaxID=57001 RepID=UPI003C7DEC56
MTLRRDFLRTTLAGLAVSLAPLPAALRAEELRVLKQGSFSGRSAHVTTGSAAITEQDGRHFVSLGHDFSFDGAPDPKVALGRDGYDGDTILGPLQSNAGAQTYALPEGFNPADYNEIWVWCERFDVPLGVASIG